MSTTAVDTSATTPTPSDSSPPPIVGYSAASLYSLANAYARAGKPGFAVLNYKRARLLDPTDPDILANLRQVRQAAGLPPPSPTRLEQLAGEVNP